jgi:hypothetical protein
MNDEQYIDHEVRIRMQERINEQLIKRANTILVVVVSGFLLPILVKFFWG